MKAVSSKPAEENDDKLTCMGSAARCKACVAGDEPKREARAVVVVAVAGK